MKSLIKTLFRVLNTISYWDNDLGEKRPRTLKRVKHWTCVLYEEKDIWILIYLGWKISYDTVLPLDLGWDIFFAAARTSHSVFDCSSQWRTPMLKLKFSVVIILHWLFIQTKVSNITTIETQLFWWINTQICGVYCISKDWYCCIFMKGRIDKNLKLELQHVQWCYVFIYNRDIKFEIIQDYLKNWARESLFQGS